MDNVCANCKHTQSIHLFATGVCDGLLCGCKGFEVEGQKPLMDPRPGEWRDSANRLFTLCVVEELHPDATEHVQAVTVIAGMAVCSEHLKMVAQNLVDGYSELEILTDIMRGSY